MSRNKTAVLALALVASWAPCSFAEVQALKIDPNHSNVSFKVRHILTIVSGHFRTFEGTIQFDEKDPARSSVDVTIQAASVDTNVADRDRDLRSPNFFDVEKHPTLSFKSTGVTGSGNAGKIKGILTIHGVSKEVALDAEFLGKAKDPWGNTRYGFHAETKIDRTEYGLTWNKVLEAGAVLVGNDVQISLDVEAMPPKP